MIELTVNGAQHRVDVPEYTPLYLPFSPDRVRAALEADV